MYRQESTSLVGRIVTIPFSFSLLCVWVFFFATSVQLVHGDGLLDSTRK
jgi:hypothetical protein